MLGCRFIKAKLVKKRYIIQNFYAVVLSNISSIMFVWDKVCCKRYVRHKRDLGVDYSVICIEFYWP